MSMGYVGNAGFSPYQAQLAYQYSSSLQYNGGIRAPCPSRWSTPV